MSRSFGVNLNNREPLIAPGYGLGDLLDLGVRAEELGFDSVWVGDSLLSRPRWEPVTLLAALSQRTTRVRLGTACVVASARHPLWLAAEWATLDRISGGRTILGVGAGSGEPSVRREFEALGLPFARRNGIFEESLRVVRALLTDGSVDFAGEHFTLDDVGFFSGSELGPMLPVQQPPPILVVSNPRVKGDAAPDVIARRLEAACRRIVEHGDGWLTCCRARHPDELEAQLEAIHAYGAATGRDTASLTVAYQVTMHVGDSHETAQAAFADYIARYYPELSRIVDLAEWGPVGSPDEIVEWIETFAAAGVDTFVCRFAAEDQAGQVERFAADVLPRARSG